MHPKFYAFRDWTENSSQDAIRLQSKKRPGWELKWKPGVLCGGLSRILLLVVVEPGP